MQKITLAFVLWTLNLGVAHSQGQPQTTNTYYGTISNPAQKCIEDICGPTAQSNLYMTKYLDRLNEYTRLASDPKQIDFSPEIAALFEQLKSENKRQGDVGLAIFRKSSSLGNKQPEGLSKAIYNVMFAGPYLKKIKYKFNTEGGKTSVTVDETATATELKDLSPEDRAWMMKLAKYFASSYMSKDGNSLSESEIRSQPPGLLLKQLHPEVSLAEAMKLELEKAQKAASALKDLSPLEKALFFTKTSPDRISIISSHVANGTVDENETREILQWNSDFKNNTSLFRNPNSPLLDRKTPTVEEIVAKAGGVESIAQAFGKDRMADVQKDEGKIWSCKLQYFINKGLLPNKDQVDNLKKDILRSKQMVIETIKAKFPPSMHQKLIKAVEDTDFITPPTTAEFEKNFSGSLKRKVDSARASSASLNDISPAAMRELIATFTLSKSSQDPNELKDDSNEYCDAFKYSPMSDANYTTYGSVLLSFTTATGDEASRLKTIMHELGHSVSKAIADDPQSFSSLAGVRKCLADQHTEELPPQMKKAMDEAKAATNPKISGPYVEEDFADAVAGESGTSVRGRNSWCQFMNLSPDRQQYQESKIQAEDGDPHSSSLFRLLNFEVMKKHSIPESCDKYLAAIKYSKKFSSCLELASPSPPSSSKSESARSVK